VSFAVERTREVANDWITAVVGTSDEDSDAARLADRVNKRMNEALAIAKQAKGVEVKSGGYATQPVHDKDGKIARWAASQDLYLESSDVDGRERARRQAADQLLSALDRVQRVARDAAQDRGAADRRCAQRVHGARKKVAAGLGARDYEIVSVSIQTPGGGGPVPMYARAEMAMDKVAAPSFESGRARSRCASTPRSSWRK
jgi:predicted secreted protein